MSEENVEIEVTWTPEQAEEAEAMGWIPPERAGKLPEGKNYVGPVEFMERNPLYKSVKELREGMAHLNGHYQKLMEKSNKEIAEKYEAKIADLENQKLQALEEGDNKAVVKIDKEIRKAEKSQETESKSDFETEFTAWKAKNDWYDKDEYLSIKADEIGQRLMSRGYSGKELLDKTTEFLKQEYPDKFSNPNREKAAKVEASTQKPMNGKKSYSLNDLNSDERMIFTNLNMGDYMDKEQVSEYVKQVIELRGE